MYANKGEEDIPRLSTPREYSKVLPNEFYVLRIGTPLPRLFSTICVGLIACTPMKEAIMAIPPTIDVAIGFIITMGKFIPT